MRDRAHAGSLAADEMRGILARHSTIDGEFPALLGMDGNDMTFWTAPLLAGGLSSPR
jgi:hypothetical protein